MRLPAVMKGCASLQLCARQDWGEERSPLWGCGVHAPDPSLSTCLHPSPLPRSMCDSMPPPCRYVFTNCDRDGWLSRGRRHAVVMKPLVERIDELQDLKEVQGILQTQMLVGTCGKGGTAKS